MKIKKKLLKSIKNRYLADMQYSKGKALGYKRCLDNYESKYGSNEQLFEKYIYYNTVVEMYKLVLKDIEHLEGKL